MRGLLVNNEDLLRTNTQLTNELKRMKEQMIEMERESQTMGEKYREMEVWCVDGWTGMMIVKLCTRFCMIESFPMLYRLK